MKYTIKALTIMIIAGLMSIVAVAATEPQRGKGSHKHSKDQPNSSARKDDKAREHISFSTRDMEVIRKYYAPRSRTLPHGLQKKLDRDGTLPPGWQKKMKPFPVVLERDLVVLPRDYRRGIMDGRAVIYNPRTHVIIDVAILF